MIKLWQPQLRFFYKLFLQCTASFINQTLQQLNLLYFHQISSCERSSITSDIYHLNKQETWQALHWLAMIRTFADTVKQVAHIHVQGASQHTLQDPVTGLEQMSHTESTDLLYDGGLYSSRLHLGQDLLLQHHLLLRLDDVLSSIGSSDHLQDLTCTANRETLFRAFKLCVNMHLMSAWNGHRDRKKSIGIDWIIQYGRCKL